MPISKSEAGNLILAINSITKVAIHSAADPYAIFNTRKMLVFQSTSL